GPPVLTYPSKLPQTVPNSTPGGGGGQAQFYWICLRRPANPFAPVSAANPMIVVDCMRFPYIEGKGTGVPGNPDTVNPRPANSLYSSQRLQPFRGGHAVPYPGLGTALDPRYGYTEQVAAPVTTSGTTGQFGNATTPITLPIYHTLGWPNDGGFTFQPPGPTLTGTTTTTQQEPWDYIPFNNPDFTSAAELLMVPGCPPGLFTKQFAEFAPSLNNVTTIFGQVKPSATPVLANVPPTGYGATTTPFAPPGTYPLQPHTFPYLVDK